MKKLLTSLIFVLCALSCFAQTNTTAKPTKGTFYISVDDGAIIFINGAQVYEAAIGETRSPELELKEGDRLVVELRNDGDKRYFMLVFAASDEQTVVSFKHRNFKIVPDPGVSDFTVAQFEGWKKYAEEDDDRKPVLPINSRSEWVWGDLDKCVLACVITPEMFSKRNR